MTGSDDNWWNEHDRNIERDIFVREGQKTRQDAYDQRELQRIRHGFTPPSKSSENTQSPSGSEQPPPAEVQLQEALSVLKSRLQHSTAIPPQVLSKWRAILNNTSMNTLGQIQDATEKLTSDYESVFRENLSIRDPASGLGYITEMMAIKESIDWIKKILDHIFDYLKKQNST